MPSINKLVLFGPSGLQLEKYGLHYNLSDWDIIFNLNPEFAEKSSSELSKERWNNIGQPV